MMKIFCASLVHESNSFSPIPTNLASYQAGLLYRPAADPDPSMLEVLFPECCLRRAAIRARHEVRDGLYAAAAPSAPTAKADYETLRDGLLESLRTALPVDCVLLFLHGAQIAQGYADCEGDLLARIRRIVGPDLPIGVELDLHTNISEAMVDNATAIATCLEYPHTDFDARAAHLLAIIEDAAAGRTRPVMAVQRVPLFGFFHTTREPMRGLISDIKAMEGGNGVLSISLCHGFAYGDCSNSGASVIVVTDGNSSLGADLAGEIADRFFSLRQEIAAPVMPLDDAVAAALACANGPVVIADTTDNPGGGAAGDSTFLLRALLDKGVANAALAMIWDPGAVEMAAKVGVGGRLQLRLGGKTGPLSGAPLDLDATVTAIRNDAHQQAFGAPAPLGPAVALKVAGVDIVVNTLREQVHSVDCFTEMGIDPHNKHILVVKSAQHFYTSFAPIARDIIYAAPPGTVGSDFATFPYKHIVRPVYPIDSAPFEIFGRTWQ